MHHRFTSQQQSYMKRAIQLAENAGNFIHPNPLVGAVIVKNGRIIGEGAHETFGSLHAERNALKSCTESPEGADIYVTLEPCCHQGKQPPCTEALIEAGISRCFIGSSDPNPLVSGKGVKLLQNAGITVFTGLLKEECDQLNPSFFHLMKTGRPLVNLKYAMSLDGKIACFNGKSQWITGETARANVSLQRAACMAVLTSVETVIADNPRLTAHGKASPDPVRIVCDSHLRTPLDSFLLSDIPEGTKNSQQGAELPPVTFDEHSRYPRTIIATCESDKEKQKAFLEKGAVMITTPPDENGHLDLSILLQNLGKMGIDSIYTECGAGLLGSLMDQHLADRAEIYLSPKILGNPAAKSPVGGKGSGDPNLAPELCPMEIKRIGEDLLMEGPIKYPKEAE
jgi:diaminohydroxyphosphoribosylaminopyrimidine deaminase/5-amino-6-(5-phosphoribosylamino)uracil reductase